MIMPAPARYRTTNWKIHNEALTVHIDASLIRSNVSMDHWFRVIWMRSRRYTTTPMVPRGTRARAASSRSSAAQTRTRPWRHPLRLRCAPACKQHTAVEDLAGVVVDVEIVTGEEHDTGRFDERMDAIEATLGGAPARITADRLYGIGRIYAALEDRRIEAVIPPLRSPRAKAAQGFPTERFKFDPHHDVVR
ncbi:transposase [Paenirhodobacter populi]|uniref:transposase n=1 Tax=Paenirhodobacter populi TaxID=2306993 RepID=UPI000FE32359|nr:transposase [Sinirhodobacter populi]RWR07664.1 hypothetical protein D2T32_11305 [Sinirhodobacter populi]